MIVFIEGAHAPQVISLLVKRAEFDTVKINNSTTNNNEQQIKWFDVLYYDYAKGCVLCQDS